jgi:hypothetical protein
MKNTSSDLPILITAFNRPDNLRRVLENLKTFEPKKIYLSIDGPRNNRDKELISSTLEAMQIIDWNCEVKYRINKVNLGLATSVTSGVDWVFESEQFVIVLEDDIILSGDFMYFCDELLKSERFNESVLTISATNLANRPCINFHSCRKSIFMHSWGWAISKSTWSKFSVAYKEDSYFPGFKILFKKLNYSLPSALFFLTVYRKLKNKSLDSWAYPMTFYGFQQNLQTVVPNVNLAVNIGFGEDATHTVSMDSRIPVSFGNLPSYISFCTVEESNEFDDWEIRNFHYGDWLRFFKLVIRKLRDLLQ